MSEIIRQDMLNDVAIQSLIKIVDAVRDYLRPNKTSTGEFINLVIEAVDNPEIYPLIAEIDKSRAEVTHD